MIYIFIPCIILKIKHFWIGAYMNFLLCFDDCDLNLARLFGNILQGKKNFVVKFCVLIGDLETDRYTDRVFEL